MRYKSQHNDAAAHIHVHYHHTVLCQMFLHQRKKFHGRHLKRNGDILIGIYLEEVYTVDVKGSTNRELFASDNPQMLENLSAHREKIVEEDLAAMMETVEGQLTAYEAGDHIIGMVIS